MIIRFNRYFYGALHLKLKVLMWLVRDITSYFKLINNNGARHIWRQFFIFQWLYLQRPTPPHLTSVLAEQLLARACENEAENAKRMRMGLEPVSQSLPSSLMTSPTVDSMPSPPQLSLTSAKMDYKSEQLVNLLSAAQNTPPPVSGGQPNQIQISAGSGAVLPQSPQFLGVSSVGLLDGVGAGAVVNGQNSVEGLRKAPILNHKLNGTEIAAVRQLITGYRESAAFLLRSADELEHLIQIQTKL